MKQFLSKSIVLIGLMGSGKSAIGKLLSDRIDVPLSDTDEIIENKTGKKIYQIFGDQGEEYFRQVEEKVIARVLNGNAHVISTGGGSILSPKTRSAIKSKCCSIWVQCDLDLISKRILHQEERPLLKKKNVLDTLKEKNEERMKFYSQADFNVINENPNLDITVDALIENLLLNKVIKK